MPGEKRRVLLVIELEGGDPATLEKDLVAWAQEQRFRVLAGQSGARVGRIHAVLLNKVVDDHG